MDEEHNDDELEERLYAMLHYVDETQANVKTTGESEPVNIVENAQRSNIRRYWRTSGDQAPTQYHKVNTPPTQYHKVNTPPTQLQKNNTPQLQNQKVNPPKEPPTVKIVNTTNQKPKEEKNASPPPKADLSLFQTPPQIIQRTIEIMENDITNPVVLESSDEDEVVEVALPPKPTITIESSDEEECVITKPSVPSKDKEKEVSKSNIDRDSASPVPSVVSSVSDDFIRGDCIALNISSRHPDNHTFDFSLHGSDLLVQTTPSKKKKKKKTKEINSSTPNAVTPSESDVCFATPKSKAKHKKQKSKSVPEKTVAGIDVYDSDSNQSKQTYIVTAKSLPSADVYDSDSNQSEIKENVPCKVNISKDADNSESSISVEDTLEASTPKINKTVCSKRLDITDDSIVDLTENDYITLDETGISESIVMANVTGFAESLDYGDEPEYSPNPDPSKLGSTKIPPMLYDNLDFDNLKGKDKVCKRRGYSLTTLRAEMEKFYNESWGGEEFNHREIQKYMSRDKNLWVIDPKDRMPGLTKRRITTCHYCDRPGHRDDMCRFKPPVCYMCGSTGHYESRCPDKICVNCGSPNGMYSSMCRNCSLWPRVTCAECGQRGHPASHCPDLWRRYHNTIDINMPLEESRQYKKHHQLYCSGCTRRGHLVHTCRVTLPFSGLPINSPYVSVYRPLYLPQVRDNAEESTFQEEDTHNGTPSNQSIDNSFSSQNSKYSRNKRQSKSPCLYETQKEFKKKKQTETLEANPNNETIASKNVRKISASKDDNDTADQTVESAPDFIPISSNNRDKEGHMIQDNEVSDTSDVVTLARIYVTNNILEKFKIAEGQEWLNITMKKYNVSVQYSNESSFLTIKGKVADQESFQAELRDWTSTKSSIDRNTSNEVYTDENNIDSALKYIPKKRELVLKIISKALDSLNDDLGEPNELYKKLTYLQKQHKILLKQKVISPDKLSNSTDDMKKILKKLNMVLLGQAGLANGRQSLSKLHALQQRLIQNDNNKLSTSLRKEIAQHYQSIFVAIERNDYLELLQKYHGVSESAKINAKKNRNDKFDLEHSQRENEEIINIISPRSPNPKIQKSLPEKALITDANGWSKVPQGTLAMLLSYRQKLKWAQLKTKNQKTRRGNMVRKIGKYIDCLYRKERITAKTVRKMKKIQQEARQFLLSAL